MPASTETLYQSEAYHKAYDIIEATDHTTRKPVEVIKLYADREDSFYQALGNFSTAVVQKALHPGEWDGSDVDSAKAELLKADPKGALGNNKDGILDDMQHAIESMVEQKIHDAGKRIGSRLNRDGASESWQR